MHFNYYFLRQLSKILDGILQGTVVSECFSQSKDELIIRFETRGNPFFIRATLTAGFSCISFPENFNRARKNSVDLFPTIIGQRVDHIRQFENERCFAIVFKDDVSLLFKLHGNRANLVFFGKEGAIEIFKNSLPADRDLHLNELDRKINWTFDNFLLHYQKPDKVFFTFGKLVWAYLKEHGFDSLSTEEKWNAIQAVRSTLEDPEYFIIQRDSILYLSLLNTGEPLTSFQHPVDAINEFFNRFMQEDTFLTEKRKAKALLIKRIQNGENYISKNAAKLQDLHAENNYKTWADLIMANMHMIKPGTDKISLPDFYREGHQVEIKLKKDLSPQKNAEAFYRKAKNQHIEIERLEKSISDKQAEIEQLKQELQKIDAIEGDLKTLRSLADKSNAQTKKEKQTVSLPYHEFEFQGFKIWVGKNAQANDELTLKYSYKEDLWLHVKDVAGSHVLIKHQSGKAYPKNVIERAAELAAFNSKRKTETLCPVVFTPKKFVRKRKGDPPGTVVVEKEEVVMVEPRL